MDRLFTWAANRIAHFVGQPLAFVLSILVVVAWAVSGPIFHYSDTWQLVILLWLVTGPLFHYSDTWQLIVNTATTIITFLMVFLIQNSQNRDAAAMQAKLDELIRAIDDARAQFIGIEHRTDREIEKIRADLEQECQPEDDVEAGKPPARTYVEQLIRRL